MRASTNRAAAARGGWRPRTSRGIFFNFTYIKSKNPPRKAHGRQPMRAAATQFALAPITIPVYVATHFNRKEESSRHAFLFTII